MKNGLNILLFDEIIEASEVEYKDCEYFIIVCPACHEPVFKAVRKTEDEEIHYLSHYSKDKSEIEECERRVDGLSIKFIKKQNAKSRGQLIKFFIGTLREGLFQGVSTEYRTMLEKKEMSLFKISKQAVLTCDFIRNKLIDAQREGTNNRLWSEWVEDANWEAINTNYSRKMQLEIAQNVLKYLLGVKGVSTFRLLFIMGCLDTYGSLIKQPKSDDVNMAIKLLKFMLWGWGIPQEVKIDENYAKALTEYIETNMMILLLRLPYLNMLKEAMNKSQEYLRKK